MKAKFFDSVAICAIAMGMGAAQGPMDPPAELKKLDWMLGEWTSTVRWTYLTTTDVAYTVKCEWDGQFLRVTSRMEMLGMTMTETAYYGWDASSKRYRGWTFTNFSSDPRIESGTLNENALVMTSEPWNVGIGQPTVSRATLTRKSSTEIHFLLEFKDNDRWTRGAEGTFTKKP